MSITSPHAEKTLIKNCIKGNPKSQKELYNRVSVKMFSICLRYSKNQMDAEDILQEAFVRLFNNLHKFKGEGSFEGWVRRIFVNASIEHIWRRKYNAELAENLGNFIVYKHTNALDTLYEKDIIKTSMKLSDGYKTVFTLYAVKGYSHKEIAKELGITVSTSKSQFSRAKAILRNLIENQPGDKDICA